MKVPNIWSLCLLLLTNSLLVMGTNPTCGQVLYRYWLPSSGSVLAGSWYLVKYLLSLLYIENEHLLGAVAGLLLLFEEETLTGREALETLNDVVDCDIWWFFFREAGSKYLQLCGELWHVNVILIIRCNMLGFMSESSLWVETRLALTMTPPP